MTDHKHLHALLQSRFHLDVKATRRSRFLGEHGIACRLLHHGLFLLQRWQMTITGIED